MAKQTRSEREKRAWKEYPGEHVLFSGGCVVAHHATAVGAYRLYEKAYPGRGGFLFHVQPKGTMERKVIIRPRSVHD